MEIVLDFQICLDTKTKVSSESYKIFTLSLPCIVFILYLCIRQAAPRQSKQVSLLSVCTVFAKDWLHLGNLTTTKASEMNGNKEYSLQTAFLRFVLVIIGARGCMGYTPDDAEWEYLYAQCKLHSLLGVGFAGVERCHGKGERCPLALRQRWMAKALRIKACNHRLNMLCAELDGLLTAGGLRCCVLKGQAHME